MNYFYYYLKVGMVIVMTVLAFSPKSCEKKKQQEKSSDEPLETTILDIQNSKFSLTIEKSGLKLDPDNEQQCAHYLNYTLNSSKGFELYAAQLTDVLAKLLSIYKDKVKIKSDTLKGEFFNIFYKGKVTPDRKKHIVKRLLNYYNLKILKKSKNVRSYTLFVKNKKKLSQFKVSSFVADSIGIQYHRKGMKVKYKNTPLSFLASSLKKPYDNYILFRGTNKQRYNFSFVLKNDFNKLIKLLETKYGLGLKRDRLKLKFYIVVPKN